MWAFAVVESEQRLRAVRDQNTESHLHMGVRRHYESASAADKKLLQENYAASTSVMTVASIWRMTIARHEFLTVAAQLHKCVEWLRSQGAEVPELKNEELIKLLRDIGEHWEQVAYRRSRGRFRELRPGDNPQAVRYGLQVIDVGGGLISRDIVRWADSVDQAVREQAKADGQSLVNPEDSVEHQLYDKPPIVCD